MIKIRTSISVFLFVIFSIVSVSGQDKNSVSDNQCEMSVNEDFVGEKVDLHVVNIDIRDFLNYITEQFGCNFSLEEKVGKIPVTTKINDLPWNIVLKSLLKNNKLDMLIKKSVSGREGLIYIGTERKIFCESSGLCCGGVYPEENSRDKTIDPLYTEFIKPKNLPVCQNNPKCEERLIALKRLEENIDPRLTNRGDVEIDEASQTIIITDIRANLDALIKLIKSLDTEEFYNEA